MATFPPSLFGPREAQKSILAQLLPALSPSQRIEAFAREAGHRSDAAFAACTDDAPTNPDAALSWRAAEGCVIPLLMFAGLPLITPTTNSRAGARPQAPEVVDILRRGGESLNQAAFKAGMRAPFQVTRTLPSGATRWFFIANIMGALFAVGAGGDRFWASKASEVSAAWLMLCDYIPDTAILGMPAINALMDTRIKGANPWESHALNLLANQRNVPDKTRESIFITAREVLSPSLLSPANRPGTAPTPFDMGISSKPWSR